MDKDVVDPDGGDNLAKKRKILGVAEVVDPEINENFPSSGFQCGIPYCRGYLLATFGNI